MCEVVVGNRNEKYKTNSNINLVDIRNIDSVYFGKRTGILRLRGINELDTSGNDK